MRIFSTKSEDYRKSYNTNLILIFFSYSVVVRNEDYFGFGQSFFSIFLFFG